jgi:hypothetical protein
VLQWHVWFNASRTSFYDDEHIGSPTSCTTPETVARIQQLVCQDWHWTIHDIAEEVGFGYGTCQQVLTKELSMHCITAKFVPSILTGDQKQQWIDIGTELCQLASDDETP